MRWIIKQKSYGMKRTIRRFLFFSRCINNERRWLEMATIQQVLRFEWGGKSYWEDVKFIDK
jgi:hypothetical protein